MNVLKETRKDLGALNPRTRTREIYGVCFVKRKPEVLNESPTKRKEKQKSPRGNTAPGGDSGVMGLLPR